MKIIKPLAEAQSRREENLGASNVIRHSFLNSPSYSSWERRRPACIFKSELHKKFFSAPLRLRERQFSKLIKKITKGIINRLFEEGFNTKLPSSLSGSIALRCSKTENICIKEKGLPHAESQSRREIFSGAPHADAASYHLFTLNLFILGAQASRLHYSIRRLLGFLNTATTKLFFWEHRHPAGKSDIQSHRVSFPSAPLRLCVRQSCIPGGQK